jgi:hypothetical protein
MSAFFKIAKRKGIYPTIEHVYPESETETEIEIIIPIHSSVFRNIEYNGYHLDY